MNERESPCWEVVGVVESSHLTRLTGTLPWQYYLPMGEATLALEAEPDAILVRAREEAPQLLASIQRELRALHPGIRFAHVGFLQERIDPHLRPWKLGATMFSLFGILALIVAAVGLYSVLAFNVARRTRELGVRSAIGASRTRLLRMVLREAAAVTGVGLGLGLVVALVCSRFLEPILFDTSPRDPLVLAGVMAALMLAALASGLIPAWSAASVDPMRALRTD